MNNRQIAVERYEDVNCKKQKNQMITQETKKQYSISHNIILPIVKNYVYIIE